MTQYQGPSRELFSGVLHKCGGKVKSWTRRWFILKDDYCLYYYKDTAKGHLGAISLRDTKFKVRKGEMGDCSWPKSVDINSSFAVVTNQRTYFMYASSHDDAEQWIRMLEGAREKLLGESQVTNRLLHGKRAQSTSVVRREGVEEGQRSLANIGRPLSENALEVPHPPNGMERQLTYEEMHPATNDLLSNQISASAPDSFYDVAKPEDGVFVDQQVYMDIETVGNDSGAPKYNIKTHEDGPTALYDDVEFVAASVKDAKPQDVYEEVNPDEPQEMYEEVNPELSIKDQPLPPLPIVSVTTATSQPIYEDIGNEGQPLYESVDPSSEGSKVGAGREAICEIEESADFSIPPRNDVTPPPLHPKDDLPPLPPKDDLPPSTPKDDLPPLPPKDDLPSKNNLPPLPPKDDDSKAVPPLPLKEDTSKQNDVFYDDVETIMEECNKLQLSELTNGTPPSQRKVNKIVTPPSPHRVDNDHKIVTPPSPRRVDKDRKIVTPPSPRRVNNDRNIVTQPSPCRVDNDRKIVTPPSPRRVDNDCKIVTPPSPRRVDNDCKIVTPPPSPGVTNKSPNTKPSPTPRRKVPMATSPAETKPRALTTTQSQRSEVKSPDPLSPESRGGMSLFLSRQERVEQLTMEENKRRADTILIMEGLSSESSFSPTHRAVVAETLREVEQERLLASEERFRWERERMKFEEEKRKFEQEKRNLQQQLDSARKLLEQNKT